MILSREPWGVIVSLGGLGEEIAEVIELWLGRDGIIEVKIEHVLIAAGPSEGVQHAPRLDRHLVLEHRLGEVDLVKIERLVEHITEVVEGPSEVIEVIVRRRLKRSPRRREQLIDDPLELGRHARQIILDASQHRAELAHEDSCLVHIEKVHKRELGLALLEKVTCSFEMLGERLRIHVYHLEGGARVWAVLRFR